MSRQQTFVIVGASLTGAKAAETLRAEGFDGRVVLLGEEPERPYERPPLSKDYLRGDVGPEKVFVHDQAFYAEHGIEVRTATRVAALDPAGHEVVLDGGERLAYDKLLLATGASPRRLSVPGADLGGVRYLRTLADAESLREAIRGAGAVAVIGAGWIGSEVAASARQVGRAVAMVDHAPVPLAHVLGPEVGGVYRNLHADHGVELHLGTGVESIRGTGQVQEIRTTDGRTIPADVVVVGVGAVPRVELAAAAGLAVEDGIVVDEQLRTSAPDVFAAGDVAAARHPLFGTRLRVEHWANALHQGPVAAKNMLGIPTPYDRIPYFFSDQYDLGMEYSGYAPTWDRVVFRGDPASGQFVAFWLAGGLVVAGMNANVWDVAAPIGDLVRSRAVIDPERLTDLHTPLEVLAAEATGAGVG